MIKADFQSGNYYIGDLKYILDYQSLCEIKFGFGKLSNGFHYANFDIGLHESGIKDSSGFVYCIDSCSIGIISANYIDKDFISKKVFTIHHGILANKFSSFAMARFLNFQNEFIVLKDENLIQIADLSIKINPSSCI